MYVTGKDIDNWTLLYVHHWHTEHLSIMGPKSKTLKEPSDGQFVWTDDEMELMLDSALAFKSEKEFADATKFCIDATNTPCAQLLMEGSSLLYSRPFSMVSRRGVESSLAIVHTTFHLLQSRYQVGRLALVLGRLGCLRISRDVWKSFSNIHDPVVKCFLS